MTIERAAELPLQEKVVADLLDNKHRVAQHREPPYAAAQGHLQSGQQARVLCLVVSGVPHVQAHPAHLQTFCP